MTNYARRTRQAAPATPIQPQTKGENKMTNFIKDMVITMLLAVIVFMVSKDGSTGQLVFPFFIIVLGSIYSYGAYESRKEDK